jgi:hypothetical protein
MLAGVAAGQDLNPAGALQQRLFDPRGDSGIGSPAAQLSLEGTKDKGSVTGKVGVLVKDSVLHFAFSGPIGEKQQEAALATLDGLANKASFEFGLTQVFWHPQADPSAQELVCAEHLIEKGVAGSLSDAKGKLREKNADSTAKYPCQRSALPAKLRDLFDNAIHWGRPVLVAASFKTAREQFAFARAPQYQDEKLGLSSYSGSISVGVLTNAVGFVRAGLQYQSAYQGQDSASVCSPLDGSTSLKCRDIAVGAPDKSIRTLMQVEMRKYLSGSLGFGPKFTYDYRKSNWGLELPVYLFQAKQGGLNGGVALGWRSDTKAFAASLFLGDVFGILNRP